MNNLEILLIKGIMIDGHYSKYRKYLDNVFNDRHNVYSKFFKFLDYIHEKEISYENLEISFFAQYPFLKKDEQEIYSDLFSRLKDIQEVPDLERLLESFKKKETALALAKSAIDLAEGKENYEEISEIAKQLLEPWHPTQDDEPEFISDNLEELLDGQINRTGLNWRLKCLREGLGPIRKGDFGFIFARPETGKTTFLASEVSYFLAQTERDHPVLWINNEEQGDKVKLRVIQAYFGVDFRELANSRNQFNSEWKSRCDGKLLIRDSATITRREVESLVDSLHPSLIVFDQIDKIKGFQDDRNDLELGKIFIWARELAKEYAPVIGVCQAGGSGENKMWLDMGDVVNAKTSKQAEADWILGIGALHDNNNLRYLHLSKNKLSGGVDAVAEARHGKFQVLIQPMIARYEDIK